MGGGEEEGVNEGHRSFATTNIDRQINLIMIIPLFHVMHSIKNEQQYYAFNLLTLNWTPAVFTALIIIVTNISHI